MDRNQYEVRSILGITNFTGSYNGASNFQSYQTLVKLSREIF